MNIRCWLESPYRHNRPLKRSIGFGFGDFTSELLGKVLAVFQNIVLSELSLFTRSLPAIHDRTEPG
ncbi:MAG: hypothetical protein OJF51_003645 [Nitrospira sp.]|jgi:hypothetical protein|nr:MAG: hypothetical protein OJF51_003645 [Nitrospira sp.]